MAPEKIALAKKLLGEGLDRHDALRRFISLGVSTEDFSQVYSQALVELGIPEPKQDMPDMSATGERDLRPHDHRHNQFLRLSSAVLVLCSLVGILLYVLYSGISYTPSNETLGTPSTVSAGDAVLQKKVDATAASGHIYRGRLGTYDGVCKDISVIPPVMCREATTGFAVYVPLSNGTQYCVDSTKKVGSTVEIGDTYARCK
jgi:hypothetical protein